MGTSVKLFLRGTSSSKYGGGYSPYLQNLIFDTTMVDCLSAYVRVV